MSLYIFKASPAVISLDREVSSEHQKPPRLLPLMLKQQLMCVWGRLIVTVSAGVIGVRCSSDGVNPPGREDGIQLSTLSAHSISTSNTNTHTHFNASSSIFRTPPSPSRSLIKIRQPGFSYPISYRSVS